MDPDRRDDTDHYRQLTAFDPTPDSIPKHRLESHFVFFYDLKARIVEATQPPSRMARNFEWREVKGSELSRFYFSDRFIEEMVIGHLHAKGPILRDSTVRFETRQGEWEFEVSHEPPGVRNVESYGYVECTLFKNGMLVVTLRLRNSKPITDEAYLESIKHPDYCDREGRYQGDYKPGGLLLAVWEQLIHDIEKEVRAMLNELRLKAVTVSGGKVRPFEVLVDDEPAAGPLLAPGNERIRLNPGQTKDAASSGKIFHRLLRSRPYVGTVLDLVPGPAETADGFSGEWPLEGSRLRSGDKPDRIAVAAGRTTPAFWHSFEGLREYVRDRNLYHPGPSIVFVARRGWACIKLDPPERDARAFHLGVVETVLYVIQALLASTRAIRRFDRAVIEEGQKHAYSLTGDFGSPGARLTDQIHAFTAFLVSARVNSPLDDLSSLLGAHLTTHTGIAAVARVNDLTEHQDRVEGARKTLANYSAFLSGMNEILSAEYLRNSVWAGRWTALGAGVAAVALMVTSFFGYQAFQHEAHPVSTAQTQTLPHVSLGKKTVVQPAGGLPCDCPSDDVKRNEESTP